MLCFLFLFHIKISVFSLEVRIMRKKFDENVRFFILWFGTDHYSRYIYFKISFFVRMNYDIVIENCSKYCNIRLKKKTCLIVKISYQMYFFVVDKL